MFRSCDGHRIGELVPIRERRRFVSRAEFAAESRTAPDADLMIASVAVAEELPLFTTNPDDYTGLEELVTVVSVTPHHP